MATSVNFFQPGTDAAADSNAILRQRELAKLLLQQGQQSPSGQMVGGQFVAPSALSYVNQLAQALGGAFMSKSADEKEREMGMRLQQQRAGEAQAFMQAANGTPASSREIAGPAAEGQAPPTQTTAAVPGDMNKALAIALQSQSPMLQGMAPEIMKRNMDAQELQQALSAAGLTGIGGNAPNGGVQSGGGAVPIAGSPGAPSGLPAGIDPRAAALTLSRNAQANKLGTMLQDANKPQTLAPGGTAWSPSQGALYTAPMAEPGLQVTNQPGGGQSAAPVANYANLKAAQAAQIAGAEAAARDPYSALVKVDTPNGPVMMTPAQARAAAGGAGAPVSPPTPGAVGNGGGPVNGQPAANPMAPRPGDTDRGMIYKQELDAAAQRLSTAQQSGDQAAAARAQQDIGALLKEVKSNKIQMPQQAQQPAPAAPSGPGIPLQTEQSQAYATSRAKSYAEMAPKLQQSGQDAASSLRNLDQLETLYKDPNVAKGALAENISGLKNLGASFGIEMKGLSSEQAAEAITNKMALASRSTAEGGGMPGAMSDADRKFLANMQPGLNKTPEGRAMIIDTSRKVAQRQIDVANLAREYEQKNGQLDLGFDRALADYAAKNQMFTQPIKGGGFKILGVK